MGALERVPGVDELTCSKTEGKNWEHLPNYSRDTLTKRMLCAFDENPAKNVFFGCKLQLHLMHHRCSSFTAIHHLLTVKASAFLSGMLLPTAATPDEVVELAVPTYIQVSVTDSPFMRSYNHSLLDHIPLVPGIPIRRCSLVVLDSASATCCNRRLSWTAWLPKGPPPATIATRLEILLFTSASLLHVIR